MRLDPPRVESVDHGDDDAKPDRRSSADRAHSSTVTVAVDERRRVRTEYQKPERNETWNVAPEDADENATDVDRGDTSNAERVNEPPMKTWTDAVDDADDDRELNASSDSRG